MATRITPARVRWTLTLSALIAGPLLYAYALFLGAFLVSRCDNHFGWFAQQGCATPYRLAILGIGTFGLGAIGAIVGAIAYWRRRKARFRENGPSGSLGID